MTREGTREASITVVVTAVGAIIGQGIVSSLRRAGLSAQIIGVDRDAHGIGCYWCDEFFPKPPCSEESPEYFDFWKNLLIGENVDLVLPGLESDVLFFNRNRALVQGTKARVALNNFELIELAQDKLVFGEALRPLGLSHIPGCLSVDWQDAINRLGAPPLLLKPRRGNGSRGVTILRDKHDFDYWSRKSTDEFLIQKFVGSDDMEFTVGAFGFGDGTGLPPIIFRRKLSVAGNTQYAEVVDHPILARTVEVISSFFKPLGPTNYQFRMEGDTPYLLEINPRFSSSTSLRAAFGYNEALMAVEFYLWGRRPTVPTIRPGRAWRYYQDHVVT